MSGNIADTKYKVSPVQEVGLEIPCFLTMFHSPLERNIRQDERICQKSVLKSSGSDDEEGILTEPDQDDEEKTRESNELPEISSNKQSSKENCKSNNKGKKK